MEDFAPVVVIYAMVEVKSPVIPTYPRTVGVGHTIDNLVHYYQIEKWIATR